MCVDGKAPGRIELCRSVKTAFRSRGNRRDEKNQKADEQSAHGNPPFVFGSYERRRRGLQRGARTNPNGVNPRSAARAHRRAYDSPDGMGEMVWIPAARWRAPS